MGKVFISYSRRDKEVVKQIVTQLTSNSKSEKAQNNVVSWEAKL
jgi:hypothetical protein